MKNLFNFLLESSEPVYWNGVQIDPKFKFMITICNALNSLLWPLLIIVASVGSIYAVFLGINMAKAEDSSKRDEARKRLINTIIAMAITVVIIILIQTVIIPNMATWLGVETTTTTES